MRIRNGWFSHGKNGRNNLSTSHMIPNKDTFCIAPYQHTCVNAKGMLEICCVSKEIKKYEYNKLQEWYHSDTLKTLRSDLLKGVKNPICKTCWIAEDSNKISQRQIYNKHIGKIIKEHWNKNFQQNTELINVISNLNHKNIKSFDLQLGNLCNLKCIMCNSRDSSQLLAEAKIHPELQQFHGNEDIKDYQWPKRKNFKEWCKTFLGSAIHIKFTGGEPFMNPYLLESLESIDDEQKKKCILHFTTNLTIINKNILEILSKFKETWISVSYEGIGKVLEYARFGHQWHDLEKNLMLVLNNQSKKLFISVSHVVQSPTFVGISDLIKYFDLLKIKLEPLFLISPKCFQLSSIKKEIKINFLNQLKNYDGYNSYYVNAIRSFIEKNLEYDPVLEKQCVSRLQAIDKIRKNNFQEIVPIDYFV